MGEEGSVRGRKTHTFEGWEVQPGHDTAQRWLTGGPTPTQHAPSYPAVHPASCLLSVCSLTRLARPILHLDLPLVQHIHAVALQGRKHSQAAQESQPRREQERSGGGQHIKTHGIQQKAAGPALQSLRTTSLPASSRRTPHTVHSPRGTAKAHRPFHQ